MAIWKARIATGVRVYFAVVSAAGVLRTGLAAGAFIVRIINPIDTASLLLTVTESVQRPGIYYVDVPSGFITTNGVGHYGLSVGVHAAGPALNDEVLFSVEITTFDYDTIPSEVWKVSTSVTTPGSFGELVKNDLTVLAAAVVAADLVAAAGSTTTVINTNATQASNFYNGLIVVVINAAGTVARRVTSYSSTNGAFTLDTALPFTPAISDRIIVLGRVASAVTSADVNAIAIAVWALSILSPTSGSYGELVNQIGNNASLIPALL